MKFHINDRIIDSKGRQCVVLGTVIQFGVIRKLRVGYDDGSQAVVLENSLPGGAA